MKNIANWVLAVCAIVFSTSCGTGKTPETGSVEAAAQLQRDLKGTYEEPDFGNDSPYLFTPMYEASFKGTKR